ncbi:Hypothetical predicted protein, partial [Paramuricea clavata]
MSDTCLITSDYMSDYMSDYIKPTDTHQYLDFKSCHPAHVKKAIPYGQALRLKRICSSEKVFQDRLKEMEGHFIKRGFNKKLVKDQFSE